MDTGGMQLITHPMRLRGGRAVTTTDGNDEARADAVARIALTRAGEWAPVPSYGITDPAFGSLAVAEINSVLDLHGYDARVELVKSARDERSERLTLSVTGL